MSNDTELHVASAMQSQVLGAIDDELKSQFLQFTTDQIASILISSLGIAGSKAIIKNLPGISRESYVKCMDLIHDCAISMWDLNEDKK